MGKKRVGTPVHGRASTYSNWGCRCSKCRAAWAEKFRKYRAELARRLRGAA